jgi:hypothetical protein
MTLYNVMGGNTIQAEHPHRFSIPFTYTTSLVLSCGCIEVGIVVPLLVQFTQRLELEWVEACHQEWQCQIPIGRCQKKHFL